ncbi:hypothetical protein SAMN05661091_1687 [Paenibacillus uliginis N3/975]|uniref:Uncharacterized protein n=1 Tax=Paenibacillus uliginis N3/975 TaxID=1313296 RepID=A0A1X7H3V6_9BACL|nr:hypothetical protein [Paenibacillus uliginis]SMF79344.1 hypothetical protein SAMN05661091_1687 [Paenibacillus uliginis N3/975]
MTRRIIVTGGAIITDSADESLQLIFKHLDEINLDTINIVQKPVFIDLKEERMGILRS